MRLLNTEATTYVFHNLISISSSSRVLCFVSFDICLLPVLPQLEAKRLPGTGDVIKVYHTDDMTHHV